MALLAAQTNGHSSPGVMVLFAAVMFLTYVGVAHQRFHKTVAALLGGGVLTLLGVLLGVFRYDEIYQFLAKDLNVFGVIIGTAAGIPYVQFLLVSAPYALVSLVVAMGVLRFAFRKQVPWHQGPEELALLRARIDEFDPWALVENRRVLLRSGVILSLTVLGFALAQWLGLGMDFIAMAGGTAALLFAGPSVEESINKVNWTVILFFMGLFLIVGCVEATGALTWLAGAVVELSGQRQVALIPLLCGFAALASSIVDNIPVAATLIPIVKSMGAMGVATEPLWWSLVIGANLGGNGTPIGSISCVIAIHTLHKEAGVTVGWGEFLKLGGTIMLLQVAGAVVYLLVLYGLGAFSWPLLQLGG